MSSQARLLPPGAVRVPWLPGTRAETATWAPAAKLGRAARCERKAAHVQDDLQLLKALAERPAERTRREHLEAEAALQERRLGWVAAAAVARREALISRAAEIEVDLGEEGLGYLDRGLPAERQRDQRLLDLLSELAIIRFALEGE